jgi:hypothetical protein
MNMSAPEGSSFNDAVITDALEQVHMATIRLLNCRVWAHLSNVEMGHDRRLQTPSSHQWRFEVPRPLLARSFFVWKHNKYLAPPQQYQRSLG